MEGRRHGASIPVVTESPTYGETLGADALERMIARLVTQRECIDFAARLTQDLPGSVLEIGLGKGRTHDHVRQVFKGREVLAFDYEIHCAPELVPDRQSLFLGDFRDTLPLAQGRLGRTVAVAHADIGSRDAKVDSALARDIAPAIAGMVRQGGIVLSDRQLPFDETGWRRLPLPAGAIETGWPYFIWQALM